MVFAPRLGFSSGDFSITVSINLVTFKIFINFPCQKSHLPRRTKGKLSGSLGAPWSKNSSLQVSRDSNDLALVISYTITQQSAPL